MITFKAFFIVYPWMDAGEGDIIYCRNLLFDEEHAFCADAEILEGKMLM